MEPMPCLKRLCRQYEAGGNHIGGVSAFVNSSTGQTGQMFSQALVKYEPE